MRILLRGVVIESYVMDEFSLGIALCSLGAGEFTLGCKKKVVEVTDVLCPGWVD